MVAIYFSRLFFTTCNIANLSLSCRAIFICFSLYQLYNYFNLLQLVIKPDSLLLEDRRSETICKGHNQTSTLLSIETALVELDHPLNYQENKKNKYDSNGYDSVKPTGVLN